jgi:hypothetical protein
MQLLDQSLISLFRSGQISREMIFSYCNDKDEIAKVVPSVETVISRNFQGPSQSSSPTPSAAK